MSTTTYENVLDFPVFFMHFVSEKYSEYIFTKYIERHFIMKQGFVKSLWVYKTCVFLGW